MKFQRSVLVCVCGGFLHAQAPVERAWSLPADGASGKNHETRMRVFQALALMANDRKARKMAETAVTLDERSEVRAAAALALGEMGAKESAPRLIEAVRDKETEVVFAVTNALFQLGDHAAYQVYYAGMTGQKKTGESLADSRMKMLEDPEALANMGLEAGTGFIPFGGISYKVFKTATADAVSPVRALAVARLVGDRDPKTGQALANTTQDPK